MTLDVDGTKCPLCRSTQHSWRWRWFDRERRWVMCLHWWHSGEMPAEVREAVVQSVLFGTVPS